MPSWAFLSVPVVRPEATPGSCCTPWIPWLEGPKASVHELSPRLWATTVTLLPPHTGVPWLRSNSQAMAGMAQNPAVLPSRLWHFEGSPEPSGQTTFARLSASGHLCSLEDFSATAVDRQRCPRGCGSVLKQTPREAAPERPSCSYLVLSKRLKAIKQEAN